MIGCSQATHMTCTTGINTTHVRGTSELSRRLRNKSTHLNEPLLPLEWLQFRSPKFSYSNNSGTTTVYCSEELDNLTIMTNHCSGYYSGYYLLVKHHTSIWLHLWIRIILSLLFLYPRQHLLVNLLVIWERLIVPINDHLVTVLATRYYLLN